MWQTVNIAVVSPHTVYDAIYDINMTRLKYRFETVTIVFSVKSYPKKEDGRHMLMYITRVMQVQLAIKYLLTCFKIEFDHAIIEANDRVASVESLIIPAGSVSELQSFV